MMAVVFNYGYSNSMFVFVLQCVKAYWASITTLRVIALALSLIVIFETSTAIAENTGSISLTAEEQAWLDKHPTIRVSGPKSFPPFQFLGPDGSFQGMATDYIQTLAKMLNLKVEIVKGLPWPQVLEKIQNNEIDVITCAAQSPDRESYLTFSDPHLSFPIVIINRKDSSFVSNIEDLNGAKLPLFVKCQPSNGCSVMRLKQPLTLLVLLLKP